MEIEKTFETFQREVKHTTKANTAKEIRVLKKVVQNLEVRKKMQFPLGHMQEIRYTCTSLHYIIDKST